MSPTPSRTNSPSDDEDKAEEIRLQKKREERARREAELKAEAEEEAAAEAQLVENCRKKEEKKKREAEEKKRKEEEEKKKKEEEEERVREEERKRKEDKDRAEKEARRKEELEREQKERSEREERESRVREDEDHAKSIGSLVRDLIARREQEKEKGKEVEKRPVCDDSVIYVGRKRKRLVMMILQLGYKGWVQHQQNLGFAPRADSTKGCHLYLMELETSGQSQLNSRQLLTVLYSVNSIRTALYSANLVPYSKSSTQVTFVQCTSTFELVLGGLNWWLYSAVQCQFNTGQQCIVPIQYLTAMSGTVWSQYGALQCCSVQHWRMGPVLLMKLRIVNISEQVWRDQSESGKMKAKRTNKTKEILIILITRSSINPSYFLAYNHYAFTMLRDHFYLTSQSLEVPQCTHRTHRNPVLVEALKKLNLEGRLKFDRDIEVKNEARCLKSNDHAMGNTSRPGSPTVSFMMVDSEEIDLIRKEPAFLKRVFDYLGPWAINFIQDCNLSNKCKAEENAKTVKTVPVRFRRVLEVSKSVIKEYRAPASSYGSVNVQSDELRDLYTCILIVKSITIRASISKAGSSVRRSGGITVTKTREVTAKKACLVPDIEEGLNNPTVISEINFPQILFDTAKQALGDDDGKKSTVYALDVPRLINKWKLPKSGDKKEGLLFSEFHEAAGFFLKFEAECTIGGKNSNSYRWFDNHFSFWLVYRGSKHLFEFVKDIEFDQRMERKIYPKPFIASSYENAWSKAKSNKARLIEVKEILMAVTAAAMSAASSPPSSSSYLSTQKQVKKPMKFGGISMPFQLGSKGKTLAPCCLGCGKQGHHIDEHTDSIHGKFSWVIFVNNVVCSPDQGNKPLCFTWNIRRECKGCDSLHVCFFCGKPDHHAFSWTCKRSPGP
ncbi:hypothetical protein F5050DRAFT_1857024 [Lentinula boryana]|uniref:Uncharacterized protein n=1 Tax=Lentinula boryana TaxID=40481 RepID=A0ABQ8QMB7_9AGAR|nr:hypothetical protein F5050DRAFT_1857024 [Lentinula boryana]